jgi:hypothetical protein
VADTGLDLLPCDGSGKIVAAFPEHPVFRIRRREGSRKGPSTAEALLVTIHPQKVTTRTTREDHDQRQVRAARNAAITEWRISMSKATKKGSTAPAVGKKASLRAFVEEFGTALHDDEAYDFDIEKLLGEACLLNVVHTEKDGTTYANIAGASPLPKGMKAPEIYNDPKAIDVNSTSFAQIDELPEFLSDKIKSSEEYGFRLALPAGIAVKSAETERPIEYPTEDINPDDVPF